MPKTKKAAAVDKAHDLRGELTDRLGPSVEHAREVAAPLLADARSKAGPVLADARSKAGPVLAEAREKATPVVEGARDKFNADVLPALVAAAAAANEATEDVRAETLRRGKATAAALKGEVAAPEPKKSHKLRNLLVILGLGAIVAAVAKKLSERESTTTWESSYTPSTPAAGAHRGEPDPTDVAGSSPDVAAADAAATPHPATTPDDPAETIDVRKD
jgi:hypothetical protein